MTSREFCFWLQGYFEIVGETPPLSVTQIDTIKRHLAMVFKHEIDPSMGDKEHQAKLDEAHAPLPLGNPPPLWAAPEGPGGVKMRC